MPKNSKLNAIREDAQVISEAISAIIELETVIVDETLTVVAGTGPATGTAPVRGRGA